MKKNKANKIAGKRKLTQEEMKGVVGGIETVPLPECIATKFTVTKYKGTVMIGTWPQPEKSV
jgi:hypothetical protein